MLDEEVICATTKFQERDLKILTLEHPTPLLRTEMDLALELHSKALRDANLEPCLEDLKITFEHVSTHWTKVYGSFSARVDLIQNIYLQSPFISSERSANHQYYAPTSESNIEA